MAELEAEEEDDGMGLPTKQSGKHNSLIDQRV